MTRFIPFFDTLRRQSRFMNFAVYLLSVALFGALAGLVLDSRTITGALAWLKPAKFAISAVIYIGTVAWLLPRIEWRPRLMRRLAHAITGILLLEIALIFLQAGRGVASHFNVATPLDAAIFAVMGSAIALLWIMSGVLGCGLFRTRFRDPAWGWALRWGMALSVLGSGMGGLMTRPTSEQLERMRAGVAVERSGQHTVGAPDGGPGLPLVNWSAEHGDLRIPHFLGLHAIQLLPLAVVLLGRRRSAGAAHVVAASYLGLTAILLAQALRGQALMAPDSVTLGLLAAWAALSFLGIAISQRRSAPATAAPAWGRL